MDIAVSSKMRNVGYRTFGLKKLQEHYHTMELIRDIFNGVLLDLFFIS